MRREFDRKTLLKSIGIGIGAAVVILLILILTMTLGRSAEDRIDSEKETILSEERYSRSSDEEILSDLEKAARESRLREEEEARRVEAEKLAAEEAARQAELKRLQE